MFHLHRIQVGVFHSQALIVLSTVYKPLGKSLDPLKTLMIFRSLLVTVIKEFIRSCNPLRHEGDA